MPLSSVEFLQVGDSLFQPGQFIRTFFQPKEVCDCYLVDDRLVEDQLQIKIQKLLSDPITGASELWTLPKFDGIGDCLPKFPTAGTAVYTHSYKTKTNDIDDSHSGEWISISEVFDRFFKDEPIGIELVHGALKVLNKHQRRLDLKDVRIPENSLGRRYNDVEQKIIKKEQLTDWEHKVADEFPLNYYHTSNPEKPFIRIESCTDNSGQEITYAARKGEHSQDSICFCWHRGQIYMAIRLGVRASLSQWQDTDNLISIEGVAGSLEENDKTEASIINRAIEETKEELGLMPAGDGIKLGSFFTASEVTAEKSTSVLVEIDPSKNCPAHHSADEIQDTRFIELDDLIQACDLGYVIDERLEVSARLLKAIYRYHNPLNLSGLAERNIGFFGGSFDPFHCAHLEVANSCIDSGSIDAVIIVPAKQNPLKLNKPWMSADSRIDSIVATVSEIPGLFVSDHEVISDKSVVYTSESVRILKENLQTDQKISLIIGSDLLESMHKWNKFDDLIDNIDRFIIKPRDGFFAQQLNSYQALYSPLAWKLISTATFIPSVNQMSSSQIKKILFDGNKSLEGVMPSRVSKFIFFS